MREEDDAFEEEFYSTRQYEDKKATLIQKVFRGYLVRKYVKLYRQQLERELKNDPPKKRTSLDSKIREMPLGVYQLQQLNITDDDPDILVIPSREHLKEQPKF